MRRLVVTCDDFGLEEPIDRAALELHEAACLDRVSLVTNTARFDSCVRALAERPDLEVGVHLNLTDGHPLVPPDRLGRLVDREGNFRGGRHGRVAALIALAPGHARAVREEWSAQVLRAREAGLPVQCLNGHGHLHLLPPLHEVVLDLAREFAVPEVRLVRRGHGWKAGLLRMLSRRLERRAGRAGVALRAPDAVLGLDRSGRLDAAALQRLLGGEWEGTAELIVHPSREGSAYHRRWRYRGEGEFRALLSADLAQRPERQTP